MSSPSSSAPASPSPHAVVQPPHFVAPRGYVNGILAAPGRTLYVAGQVGWEPDGTFASLAFVSQFVRALDNILDIVRAAGGRPEHVVTLTVFCTNLDAYRAGLKQLGAAWRERFGRHYPAMALIGVAALLEEGAEVEIQAIAVIPE